MDIAHVNYHKGDVKSMIAGWIQAEIVCNNCGTMVAWGSVVLHGDALYCLSMCIV